MPETTKPKRTLSEDALAKLKIAREKALAVKKEMKQKTDEGKIQHYEEKIQKLRSKYPPKEPEPEEAKEALKEENVELLPSPVPKPKPKSKAKKPVVICDGSSSESDDGGNVIYIRRKSSKKHKEPIPPPPPQPPQREIVVNPNPFYRYNLNHHFM